MFPNSGEWGLKRPCRVLLMRPERFALTDKTGSIIALLLPGKTSDCGVTQQMPNLYLLLKHLGLAVG